MAHRAGEGGSVVLLFRANLIHCRTTLALGWRRPVDVDAHWLALVALLQGGVKVGGIVGCRRDSIACEVPAALACGRLVLLVLLLLNRNLFAMVCADQDALGRENDRFVMCYCWWCDPAHCAPSWTGVTSTQPRRRASRPAHT